MRRIAFFFSMRRVSLFETNQRLRRTVLKTPLLTTFLRKRFSKESWDSPLRKFTPAIEIHHLSFRNENSACIQSRPRISKKGSEPNDATIKKRASLLLDFELWMDLPSTPKLLSRLYTIHARMKRYRAWN